MSKNEIEEQSELLKAVAKCGATYRGHLDINHIVMPDKQMYRVHNKEHIWYIHHISGARQTSIGKNASAALIQIALLKLHTSFLEYQIEG